MALSDLFLGLIAVLVQTMGALLTTLYAKLIDILGNENSYTSNNGVSGDALSTNNARNGIRKPKSVVSINSHSYIIDKCLGEGGSGFVYLVRDIGSGTKYALKELIIQLAEHEARARHEIKMHTSLGEATKNGLVVSLIDSQLVDSKGQTAPTPQNEAELGDSFWDVGEIAPSQSIDPMAKPTATGGFLVLEYFRNGSCQDLINNSYDVVPVNNDSVSIDIGTNNTIKNGIDLFTILRLTIDVCKSLAALHDHLPRPLVFRDLKPGNVLISDSGKGVLADLGSVAAADIVLKSRKDALLLQEICAETVTAPYRPPELFEPPSNGTLDTRTDIWSLGCFIYALAYGQPPYDGSLTAAVSGRIDFPDIKAQGGRPQELKDLITTLLQRKPERRPTVPQVAEYCSRLLQKVST